MEHFDYYRNTDNLSLLYQTVISNLAKCFNNNQSANYHANNTSNGVSMPQAIYLTAGKNVQILLCKSILYIYRAIW